MEKISSIINLFYKYAQEVTNTAQLSKVINGVWEDPKINAAISKSLEDSFNKAIDNIYADLNSGRLKSDEDFVGGVTINPNLIISATKDEAGTWIVNEARFAGPHKISASPVFKPYVSRNLGEGGFNSVVESLLKPAIAVALNSTGNKQLIPGDSISGYEALIAQPMDIQT